MKKRMISFDTSAGAGKSMSEVITAYAHAAYPVGGSDCAATTRQALLEVADKLLGAGEVDISARQRPMLKAAINWYYTEVDKESPEMHERLASQFVRKGK